MNIPARTASALVAALVLLVGCGDVGQEAPPSPTGTVRSAPATDPHRLDGVYKLTSQSKKSYDVEVPDDRPLDQQWVFRSACVDDRCLAFGRRVGTTDAAQLFEFTDGAWTRTSLAPSEGSCTDESTGQRIDAPMWVTWTLREQPTRDMTGQLIQAQVGECQTYFDYGVTLARTGDVPPDTDLPDPAEVAREAPSPPPAAAMGVQGRYALTQTAASGTGGAPVTERKQLITRCLTRGDQLSEPMSDQCLTTMLDDPDAAAGGKRQVRNFTLTGARLLYRSEELVPCDDGTTAPTVWTAALDLPAAPVPDPVPRLSGTYDIDVTGPCSATSSSWAWRLERTGD